MSATATSSWSASRSGRRVIETAYEVFGDLRIPGLALTAGAAGVLPASAVAAIAAAKQLQDLLLAGGMFGLGTGVRLRELARTGAKPLVLGPASWALIASAAYIGVRVTS
ncbi:hypothetical protein [Catenulispora sp. GAS73]|uniref:hypothetical protein n=1 Tax=Catenulispora sp. GAS73 TaxID=3156269 RepID=UPI00351473E8